MWIGWHQIKLIYMKVYEVGNNELIGKKYKYDVILVRFRWIDFVYD